MMYILIIINDNKIKKILNYTNLEKAIVEYGCYKNNHRYLFDIYRNAVVLLMEDIS